MDIFRELVAGGEISILFSTHITSDLEKCADFITFIENGKIVHSADKEQFIASYRLLTGEASMINQIKDRLISYKTNSFGFTGLIHSRDFDPSSGIKATAPSLEEIMIYFAKEDMYV